MTRRLARALRRLRRSRSGGATVEFVIVFPLFIAIFLSSFEASMMLIRQLMLERALDVTMRDVRLSTGATFPAAILRRSVCGEARILPDCDVSLTIEITPVDQATYAMPSTRAACAGTAGSAVPASDLSGRASGELMLVRACYAVAPLFPTSLLGLELARGDGADDGRYQIVTASAFVQEPGR